MAKAASGRKQFPAIGLAAVLGCGLLAASVLVSSPTEATASLRSDIMPTSDIKPGMKGHAVTVFSGEKGDRFEIEVIDVVPDFQPGQDAVLFTSTDPRMKHSGIVGGMSGSPVYIDGKLIGAIAYGWRFNKDPIGGITPIEDMLAVDKLPFRPDVLPGAKPRQRKGTAAWADTMLGLGVSPLPARKRPDEIGLHGGLEPIGTPLTLGGFGPKTSAFLSDTLGMVPVRGGSGGGMKLTKTPAKKKQWKPGDSISVLLVAGDLNAAPNGTVTWVGGKKGERLLAFGHPMFEHGPTRFPIADARVHVILPSVERSVKMSSPLSVQGTLVQDRLPAIAARTDLDTPMIPVTTKVDAPDAKVAHRSYDSRVADNILLTPSLVAGLLFQAIESSASDVAEVTVDVQHQIKLETEKGPRTLELQEEFFFPLGVARVPLLRSRAMLAMLAATDNEFEIAKLRSIEQTIKIEYGAPVEEVDEIRLVSGEVRAGDVLQVDVKLRKPRGDTRTERVTLRVPDDAGDQEIMIEIAGGDYVLPYNPVPKSVDDLLDTVSRSYPSRAMVASIYREGEGLSTDHGLMPNLPDSVLETLSPGGASVDAVRFKRLARRVLPAKTIIEGRHKLKVKVLPKKLSSK
jgi:hypothetical protein